MCINLETCQITVVCSNLLWGVTKIGNGERGTGNGERGAGNRSQGTSHECTAVTRLRIQNGGQRKRKGSKIKENNLGKYEEVTWL